MNCKFFCGKKLHSLKKNTLPLFRHMDYSTIGYNLDFKVCNYCGTILTLNSLKGKEDLLKQINF